MNTNLFTYLDYRKFLRDLYDELKETTGHFSFRYFAKQAGFKSPNYLKLVMDGERSLSQNGIMKFCKGLKLNKGEREFFENLVHMNQAKTDEEKNFYYKRLMSSRKYINLKGVEKYQYKYYSKWYYVAVRELVSLPDFVEDSKWISSKLEKKITPRQATSAIKLLIKLNFLKRDEDGRLAHVDSSVSTGPEVRSLAVSNFHREMLSKASESISETKPEHRDISSLTIPVSKETLEEVKKKVQEFRKDLYAFVADQEEYDSVYQFNFQLFNLSEVPWKNSEE